jgi:hypothetical protein
VSKWQKVERITHEHHGMWAKAVWVEDFKWGPNQKSRKVRHERRAVISQWTLNGMVYPHNIPAYPPFGVQWYVREPKAEKLSSDVIFGERLMNLPDGTRVKVVECIYGRSSHAKHVGTLASDGSDSRQDRMVITNDVGVCWATAVCLAPEPKLETLSVTLPDTAHYMVSGPTLIGNSEPSRFSTVRVERMEDTTHPASTGPAAVEALGPSQFVAREERIRTYEGEELMNLPDLCRVRVIKCSTSDRDHEGVFGALGERFANEGSRQVIAIGVQCAAISVQLVGVQS